MGFAEFLALFGTTQVVLTGIASYVGKLWLANFMANIKHSHEKELVELQGQHNKEITRLEGKLDRALQFDITELAVWEQLRKDIVRQMWDEHRELMKGMTAVHIKMQKYWGDIMDEDGLHMRTIRDQEFTEIMAKLTPGKEPTVEKYRQLWRHHTLLAPYGERVAHEYLLTAYEFMDYMRRCLEHMTAATPDGFGKYHEKLLEKQWEFKQHTAKQFGLEGVIPWMVRWGAGEEAERAGTQGGSRPGA